MTDDWWLMTDQRWKLTLYAHCRVAKWNNEKWHSKKLENRPFYELIVLQYAGVVFHFSQLVRVLLTTPSLFLRRGMSAWDRCSRSGNIVLFFYLPLITFHSTSGICSAYSNHTIHLYTEIVTIIQWLQTRTILVLFVLSMLARPPGLSEDMEGRSSRVRTRPPSAFGHDPDHLITSSPHHVTLNMRRGLGPYQYYTIRRVQ